MCLLPACLHTYQLNRVMGSPCSDSQWAQATLAIRCGGLGLMDPVDQRPAARVSGLIHFAQQGPRVLGIDGNDDLMPRDVRATVDALSQRLPEMHPLPAWSTDPALIKHAIRPQTEQRWWSEKLHTERQQVLLGAPRWRGWRPVSLPNNATCQ